jgi:integrase
VFFKEDGDPIRNLQYSWVWWRQTLRRMKVRYRDAYNARHASVSWNLMIGKNPLWVAKQHGHRVQTMLEVYAAWIEAAGEADVVAIRLAMNWTGGGISPIGDHSTPSAPSPPGIRQ